MPDTLDIEVIWNDRVFPGYYMSDLDDALTNGLWEALACSPAHSGIHPDAETPGTPIAEAIETCQDRFPWRVAAEALARDWHLAAARLIGLPHALFAGLDSPPAYNFRGDQVRFLVRPSGWRAFVERATRTAPRTINAVLRDALTPYPGFWPRYPARLSEWHPDPARWTPAQCGLIVEAVAVCTVYGDEDAAAYYGRGDCPQTAFAADVYDELDSSYAFTDAVYVAIDHAARRDAVFRDAWDRLARLIGRDAA